MSEPLVVIERVGQSGYFTLHLNTEELPARCWKYAQWFLDELKEAVPPADREYNPTTQVWTIHDSYYQTVQEIRRRHFAKDQISLFDTP